MGNGVRASALLTALFISVAPAQAGPKIAENVSPVPQDRFWFNYNYFEGAAGGRFGRNGNFVPDYDSLYAQFKVNLPLGDRFLVGGQILGDVIDLSQFNLDGDLFAASGNFFYSHAFTSHFGEPFTHSGVLGASAGFSRRDVGNVDLDAWWLGGVGKVCGPMHNVGGEIGIGKLDTPGLDSDFLYANLNSQIFVSQAFGIGGALDYIRFRDFDNSALRLSLNIAVQPFETLPLSVGLEAGRTRYKWPGLSDSAYDVGLRLKWYCFGPRQQRKPTLLETSRYDLATSMPHGLRYNF